MFQNVTKIGAIAALACATAIGVAAQTANPPQTKAASSPEQVKITGCVQRADATPTGTSGTAGATSSGPKFILANATSASSSSSAPTAGTAGTSGSSASASTASSYRLDGDDSKLTPHVGHKVEVTGSVDATSASTTATPGASSSMSAPSLKVDSVKMIAASCTP